MEKIKPIRWLKLSGWCWIICFAVLFTTGCDQTQSDRNTSGNEGISSELKNYDRYYKFIKSRPLYYHREIIEEDLINRTLRELSLMRNIVYARAGQIFRTYWLNKFFSNEHWYEPTSLDPSKISELDYKNIKLIVEHELSITREELVKRKESLLDKTWWYKYSELEVELVLVARALGESVRDYKLKGTSGEFVGPNERELIFPAGHESFTGPMDNLNLFNLEFKRNWLEGYSRRELRAVRNFIYARKGRSYEKFYWLNKYLSRFAWYKPDTAFTVDSLSSIDHKNLNLILTMENEMEDPLFFEDDDWNWLHHS